MCKRDTIESIQVNLNYVVEDANTALSYAKEIKDSELTDKLTKLKTDALGVKDYLNSKTDSKTG